jgi:hypothetical protein
MKESKIVLYSIIAALALFLVVWLAIPTPKHTVDIPMPQHATNRDGVTTVFGLTIGTSTLEDAMRIFGTEVKVSLFKEKNKANEVEAYFESTKVGGLSIRMMVGLNVSDDILEILNQNVEDYEILPSGREQVEFNNFANHHLLDTTIKHISFVPRVVIDDATIVQLFGEPQLKNDAGWHYPQKGLNIVKSEELNIFEYQNSY